MPKRRDEQAPYWQQLRVAEKGIIEYALEHGITIRGTAVILGISPNYLGERLRLLGIPVPDVRPGPKPGTKRPVVPKLRVVEETPPGETLDEDADDKDADEDTNDEVEGEGEGEDVLEDETEEGQDDDEEGDPWDGEDEDEDEDEDDGNDESKDANAQGN
ncbi:MAG: hypothetical protein JWO36_3417 [Myxococcales bacterium]|nr:hypothetical protein [Myxococcales bacterium]